jgi:hypothetical protein
VAHQIFLGSIFAILAISIFLRPLEHSESRTEPGVEARIDHLPDDGSWRRRLQEGALCGDDIGQVVLSGDF